MRRPLLAAGLTAGLLVAATTVALSAPSSAADARTAASGSDSRLATAFAATTRSTPWRLVQRLPLRFPTHHPQGFALVGDRIFMSTVEILELPARYPTPVDGMDRSPGKGVGHVLVMDRRGTLLRDIVLGEGDVYHPGGIDFDGTSVWVPVAEYRPGSRAIVYRVDPASLQATEAFRVDDHVGGVVRDPRSGRVHGVSWGSRTEYTWTTAGRELAARPNPSHLVDHQDCAHVAAGKQLCSGVTGLPGPRGTTYELGGLALKDLRDGRVLHEIPFPAFSAAGHVVTRNPVALETSGAIMRMFAAPDDGEETAGTELLVYETRLPG